MGISESLRALCARMDTTAFFRFVAARRKRSTQPAVMCCLDPGKSVMDAIADLFPSDRLEMKKPTNLA